MSAGTFAYILPYRRRNYTFQQDDGEDDDDQQVSQHHHEDHLEEEEGNERRVPAHPQHHVETANRQDDQRKDYDRQDHDQILVCQRPDTRRKDNEHFNAEPPRHRHNHCGSQSGTPTASRNT